MSHWEHIGVLPSVSEQLIKNAYITPTLVQNKSLPITLNSKDAIISAPTGEGKTLCFAIPIVQRFLSATNPVVPFALILAPTRELAIQISDHIKKICSINVLTIIGGMSKQKQERLASKKPPIIVSTPGRLYDMIDNEFISTIYKVKFLVIDEADRMVQDGHFKELRAILDKVYSAGRNPFSEIPEESQEADVKLTGEMKELYDKAIDLNKVDTPAQAESTPPTKRQTIILSATIPLDMEGRFKSKNANKRKKQTVDVMEKFTDMIQFRGKPKIINLTTGKQVSEKLIQFYKQCTKDYKDIVLYEFIRSHSNHSYIVFTNAITCCKRLCSLLQALGISAFCLHSKMQQRQRLKNFERFTKLHSESKDAVLVCTDVAARGIDIPLVEHVVHFQFPSNTEVYIHRVGRTARMREGGDTLAIIGPDDYDNYKAVSKQIESQIVEWSYKGSDSNSIENYVQTVRELESQQHQQIKANIAISSLKRLAEDTDIFEPEQHRNTQKKKFEFNMMEPIRGCTVLTPEKADYLNSLSKRNIY